jgi:hypothetical protein
MREPTEEMDEAGSNMLIEREIVVNGYMREDYPEDQLPTSLCINGDGSIQFAVLDGGDAVPCWQAMIDTALA